MRILCPIKLSIVNDPKEREKVVDISLRKEADHRLQKAYEERNQILESIGDAFFTLDNNWKITYWNKESERIVGQNRDELLGKVFWEAFPNLVGTLYEENYKTAVKTGKSIYFQDYFEFLNIWLDISAYPSENGLSVYYKDITKTKKHEEILPEIIVKLC